MMDADRTALTDAMWARIEPMPPGRATDPGATAADSRQFVEAMPVRFRTGSPWCDLPERLGNRGNVSRRFRRRALSGDLPFGAFVGDRAFDADWLPGDVEGRGAAPVVPAGRNRTEPREHDREMYGWRHQVESFFARTRGFRAVATRYDRTDAGFAAGIHPVAGVVAAT